MEDTMKNLTATLLPNLPIPPKELIAYRAPNSMINSDGTTVHEGGIYRQMDKFYDGALKKCCKPASLLASNMLTDWVDLNITTNYRAVRINYYIPMADTCDSIGVHTDKLSTHILLFNIDTGGPNAALTMWREPGFPLVREPGLSFNNVENFEKVLEINGPVNCWYLINAHILHSVEKVVRPRVNIQIGFTTEHLEFDSPLTRIL
jgi:hypothetical protein